MKVGNNCSKENPDAKALEAAKTLPSWGLTLCRVMDS